MLQQDARDELKIFSQARTTRFLSALPGYTYDAKGGLGITVYVMDTGIYPDHPVSVIDYQYSIILTHLQEFRNMPGSIRWLYLPNEPHIRSDEVGHGTCTTSKVVGPAYGVAKNADIVVVKIRPATVDFKISHMIAAWGVVATDIASKGNQAKAVVLITLSSEKSRPWILGI